MDIGDLSIVPEQVEKGMRGPGAWSFYENIPKRKIPQSIKEFQKFEKINDMLQKEAKIKLVESLEYDKFDKIQAVVGKVVVSLFYTKILTFCTHNFSHECFRMHAQENGYYCVVATGQMILDFWRYHYTQDHIANAMGTTTGGTSYAGEVTGLEALTCSHFDAQSDMSPTFTKVKNEINANRPFDYSYSYHAMACAGYRRLNFQILGVQSNSVLLMLLTVRALPFLPLNSGDSGLLFMNFFMRH